MKIQLQLRTAEEGEGLGHQVLPEIDLPSRMELLLRLRFVYKPEKSA
jgi:hypothetical protein